MAPRPLVVGWVLHLAASMVACGAPATPTVKAFSNAALSTDETVAGLGDSPTTRAALCLSRAAEAPADAAALRCYRQAMSRLGRNAEVVAQLQHWRVTADSPERWVALAEALEGRAPTLGLDLLDRCLSRRPVPLPCARARLEWALAEHDEHAPPTLAIDHPDLVLLQAMQKGAFATLKSQTQQGPIADAATNRVLWRAQATLALALGEPDQAEVALKAWATVNPDDPEVHALSSRAALARQQLGEALTSARTALDCDDSAPNAHLAWAAAARAARRPAEAIESLNFALNRRLEDPALGVELSSVYLEAGDPASAWAHAERAARGDVLDERSALVRTLALIALDRVDEALPLRPLVYAQPRLESSSRFAVAAALDESGHSLQADAEWSAAVRSLPLDAKLWVGYARFLLSHGTPQRAIDLLRGSSERAHDEAAFVTVLSAALEANDDPGGARSLLAEAVDRFPNASGFDEWNEAIARLDFMGGEPALGIARWEALVARLPPEHAALRHLALAYRALDRPRDALRVIEPHARARAADADVALEWGEAAFLSDEEERALAPLSFASTHPATRARALTLLAASLTSIGRLTEALPVYEDAIEAMPASRALRMTLATLHTRLGDHEAARSVVQALLARHPEDVGAKELLSSLDGASAPPVDAPLIAYPSALLDPDLKALVDGLPPPGGDTYATVLRDERYVSLGSTGVERVTFRRSILLQSPAAVERYREVVVPFNVAHAPTITTARTLTPDGETIGLPEHGRSVRNPHDGSPLSGDSRELLLRFAQLEPGAIIDYEVVVLRPQVHGLGAYWDRYILANIDPTRRARYSVSMPKGARPSVRATAMGPGVSRFEGGRRVVDYIREDLPGYALDRVEKADDSPIPSVSVSSTRTWSDVDAWYSAIFADQAQADETLKTFARTLAPPSASRRQRIAAVFKFVLDEIKYVGLELGLGAYRPRPARLTFEGRRGDCKDMTALMVALLGALDVPSQAVLVRPESGGAHDEDHPSPAQFNHVVLYVRDDKREHFLDATARQFTLDAVPPALRGRPALIIDGRGGRRVSIPAGSAGHSRLVDEWSYRLSLTGGGDLTRSLTATGDVAAEARLVLASVDRSSSLDLLSSPGLILGGALVPDQLTLDGALDVEAPLGLKATINHPDLVGVRSDGALVVAVDVDSLMAGPFALSRNVDGPSPRRFQRRVRLVAPPGYHFDEPGPEAPVRGEFLDASRVSRRTTDGLLADIVVSVKSLPRTRQEGARFEAELMAARARLNTRLILEPGPEFDRVAFYFALAAERPDDLHIVEMLAAALLRANRGAEASRSLRAHFAKHPRSASLAALLIEALGEALGEAPGPETNPAQALGEARVIALMFPAEVRVQAALGDLAADVGAVQIAEQAYQAALSLDADNMQLLNNLAWLLRDDGTRREEAVALVLRALGIDPKADAVWDTLAVLRLRASDFAEAEIAAREALKWAPEERASVYRQRLLEIDQSRRDSPRFSPSSSGADGSSADGTR